MSAASLHAFFAAMAPMLEARGDAAAVESMLGASPSGTEALGFYGELVRRNLHKILCDVFPSVRVLSRRASGDGESWTQLAKAYAAAHPGSGGDPNAFAARFPTWLRAQPEIPELWSELADYESTRVVAYHAPDGDDDGFERRLFVRQYTCDVPRLARHLHDDPRAELPEPRPTIAIVFRHARTQLLSVFYPGPAGLAVLAQRQGLSLPPMLAAIAEADLDAATRALVEAGVLVSGDPPGVGVNHA